MLQPTVPFPRAAHDGAFPEDGSVDDQLRFMLNYAVLAPSVMNSQPWRFRIAGGEVLVLADRSRGLPALDPDGRELVISCGAALMNLRLAVRHYGYSVSFEPVDDPADPDVLAALSVGKPAPATRDEESLFGAIPRRETERWPFAEMEVPLGAIREIERDAEAEGARLKALVEIGEKEAIAARVGEAIRSLAADPDIRRDVTSWLRSNEDPRYDGVRDAWQPPGGLHSEARIPADTLAMTMEHVAAGSPAILVLSTPRDDRASWLAAGQALERVLLRATVHGMAVSYLNQVTEAPSERIRVMELTGGAFPQVVFRIGHPLPRGGTLRRRVDDVLVD